MKLVLKFCLLNILLYSFNPSLGQMSTPCPQGATCGPCTSGGPNCCSVQACGNGVITNGSISCSQSCPVPGCPLLQKCGANSIIQNTIIMCTVNIPEIPTANIRQVSISPVLTQTATDLKQTPPINLGVITQPYSLNFAVPPLNGQVTYTFQPAQGTLAGQTIELVLKHLVKTINEEGARVELLELLTQKAGIASHFLFSATVSSAVNQFTDLFPNGTFIILPNGNFTIEHRAPAPTVIDITGNLIKKST